MSNKKYEILMDEKNTIEFEGRTLHRIKALRDFGDVKKGDIGGFVENDYNLSHEGNCWIYDSAKAMDNSRIYGDSEMYENSKMYGNSKMHDNSKMYGNTIMYDFSELHGNSRMYNYSKMYNYSSMHDCSRMYGDSEMHENSKMYDYSVMHDCSKMYGDSAMYGNSRMHNDSELHNKAKLYGKLFLKVDDYVEINNPRGRLVTCVRKGDNILYNVGCQDEIDEETFKYRIEHENGGLENNPHRKYYYKIIEESKILLLNK